MLPYFFCAAIAFVKYMPRRPPSGSTESAGCSHSPAVIADPDGQSTRSNEKRVGSLVPQEGGGQLQEEAERLGAASVHFLVSTIGAWNAAWIRDGPLRWDALEESEHDETAGTLVDEDYLYQILEGTDDDAEESALTEILRGTPYRQLPRDSLPPENRAEPPAIPNERTVAAQMLALRECMHAREQQHGLTAHEDPGECPSDVHMSRVQGWLPPANDGNAYDKLASVLRECVRALEDSAAQAQILKKSD